MDELNKAREALTWIDGVGTDEYFLAKAQAYAAIAQAEAHQRQAAALEKIASSLCMDNDLNVIDALYAVVEALTKTIRGV